MSGGGVGRKFIARSQESHHHIAWIFTSFQVSLYFLHYTLGTNSKFGDLLIFDRPLYFCVTTKIEVFSATAKPITNRLNQSRTGCKFLTGQVVQEGAAPLCRNDFSYRYCRLRTIIQWCIAKNRGGYTLEMRHRRCRAACAEGARIDAEGVGFLGRGCPPLQPTNRSGGAS